MYYLTPDIILQANKNIESLDPKVGGLFCVLHCLLENIEENVSYTINGEQLRKQLSFVFDKEPIDSFENAKASYVIFARDWASTFFNNFIKEKVDLLSCAIFFLRRYKFEREYSKEEVIDIFLKRFNLQNFKSRWFSDNNTLDILYNQCDVEDNQVEFYSKMNYTGDFKSILFSGVIKKSAADLKAAGQIQTLYSGSIIHTSLLLSDEPLDKYYVMNNSKAIEDEDFLSPEWFKEKATDYPSYDDKAQELLESFQSRFSPEKLSALVGKDILTTIFINPENTANMCYEMEFNGDYKKYFGSIKSGTSYKYGLHYSKKNDSWATGTSQNQEFISEEKAIEVGTQIRDYLVKGAETIKNFGVLDSLDDYIKLEEELDKATSGYINRVWFLKYYQMLFPEILMPIYSQNAQNTTLCAIGNKPLNTPIARMGQLVDYANQCGISNVMFNRIFWDNYNPENLVENKDDEGSVSKLTFESRIVCDIPRNRIIFGAPGTGKSHTLNKEVETLVTEMNAEYERVTFHPDYSYANFVGTYKPVPTLTDDGKETITYKYVPGPFMRVLTNALLNVNSTEAEPKPFILVIEEINRANVAAVFGDVFQLLDRDDDNCSEYKIVASEDLKKHLSDKLHCSLETVSELKIPSNMFIWATMNSADQGVFPMDTAFKRRWDFTYLGIDNGDDNIANKTVTLGKGDYARTIEWNKLRKEINRVLSSKDFKINEDKLMGPYFLSTKVIPLNGEINKERFVEAFKSKVIMYLFEDAAKQKKHTLFSGCSDTTRYSSIRDEFDEKGVFIFCDEIHNKFPAPQNEEGEVE